MAELNRPWIAEESLSDLTLYADWDSMASMIAALRVNLFEYGVIPTWNFLICGGRPELSIPSSWAYTWPSLFAYALPPNQALILVWMLMSVVGFLAMRRLLIRWTGNGLGATVGACVYVFNGYFAVRFNVGQVSFAFFHLIPVMMLVYERAFQSELAGERSLSLALLTTLLAYSFFTSGLPHALMHLYPAFLLLVVYRVLEAALRSGWLKSLKATARPLLAHVLGLWLAAYKILPVMAWQQEFPRGNVRLESYDLLMLLSNTVTFVTDYFGVGRGFQKPWHVYPSPGYNAYVGPMVWVLALFAVAIWIRPRARIRNAKSPPTDQGIMWFAIILLFAGLSLSLGNDSSFSFGYIFRKIPLLEGIRAFNRYQILTVFALCILISMGFAFLSRIWNGKGAPKSVLGLTALAICLPVLAQAFVLIWNINSVPDSKLFALYETAKNPQPPQLIVAAVRKKIPRLDPRHRMGNDHQKVLIEHGYWIGNCREDITYPRRMMGLPFATRKAITDPPPSGIKKLKMNALTLTYREGLTGNIVPQFPLLKGFRYSTQPKGWFQGTIFFRAEDLRKGELTIVADYPGLKKGFWMTVGGLFVTAVFFSLGYGRFLNRRKRSEGT